MGFFGSSFSANVAKEESVPTATTAAPSTAAQPSGRDLFFTPTSSSSADASSSGADAPSSSSSPSPATGGGGDASAPAASASTYTFPKPKQRERKFIDKEELNDSDLLPSRGEHAAYAGGGNRVPHFSQIKDFYDLTNPVTGKSAYFGLLPWRCSDRAADWVLSFTSFDGPRTHYHHYKLLRQCSRAELGDEPLEPYLRLSRDSSLYYKERAEAGMMRMRFWEQYPFESTAVRAVSETDAVRMRTWRQQRHLEEVSKSDHVDDIIKASVLRSDKRVGERLDESNLYTGGGSSHK